MREFFDILGLVSLIILGVALSLGASGGTVREFFEILVMVSLTGIIIAMALGAVDFAIDRVKRFWHRRDR